jgi:hypothetical protein
MEEDPSIRAVLETAAGRRDGKKLFYPFLRRIGQWDGDCAQLSDRKKSADRFDRVARGESHDGSRVQPDRMHGFQLSGDQTG